MSCWVKNKKKKNNKQHTTTTTKNKIIIINNNNKIINKIPPRPLLLKIDPPMTLIKLWKQCTAMKCTPRQGISVENSTHHGMFLPVAHFSFVGPLQQQWKNTLRHQTWTTQSTSRSSPWPSFLHSLGAWGMSLTFRSLPGTGGCWRIQNSQKVLFLALPCHHGSGWR